VPRRRWTVALAAVAGLAAAAVTAATLPAGAGTTDQTSIAQPVCQRPTEGYMGCLALRVPAPAGQFRPMMPPKGYRPVDLQSAYRLPSRTAGTGQTVAIVAAYDYPNVEADLAVYRRTFGLPPCTGVNGCLRKVDEHGATHYPKPAPRNDDWTGEIALDIDMVSAVCPRCHILLVEAAKPADVDLGTGVDTAVRLGARYVSNSYGGPEDTRLDHYYNHPGVVVTVSAGDNGDADYGSPATNPFVIAVGGTTLKHSTNARGWTEKAWRGTGSGCSHHEPKPAWQSDTGCSHRSIVDVSVVADPDTGLAVYDTFNGNGGWNEFGGTSASAPIVAAAFALAGPPRAGDFPVTDLYQHPTSLFDVTKGSNGTVGEGSCTVAYLCTAGPGYDGPTGLGTPNGLTALRRGTVGAVAVTNPGAVSTVAGRPARLQIRARGTALTYRATGLPKGLSINRSTGLISGTPAVVGTFGVAVTVRDSTGAWDSTGFLWTSTLAPR
jgi:Putative Ig domain/Subtilase family